MYTTDLSRYKQGSYHDIKPHHCCLCDKCKDPIQFRYYTHPPAKDFFREEHHHYMICKLHLLTDPPQ